MLVDAGNLAEEPEKTGVVQQIMERDGYDGVGTGALDAAAAPAYTAAARRYRTPVARLLPGGDGIDSVALRLRVKRVRGHTVGITAVPPPPKGHDAERYLQDAARAVQQLRGQCQFLVVLSQLGLERDERLARLCGDKGPEAIVGNLDAQKLPRPLWIGRTALLPTGPGALKVGIAELAFPLWGGQPRVTSARVLDVKGGTSSDQVVNEAIANYYRETQQEFLAAVDPRLLTKAMEKGAGDRLRCSPCHALESRRWEGTRHAHAVETLIRKGRLVPECIVCHSTRYRETRVFDHAARAGSVDCTGCHAIAPAGQHTRCPQKATRTQGEKTCLPCHTPANSPGFSYGGYIHRVDHTQETAAPFALPMPPAGPAMKAPK